MKNESYMLPEEKLYNAFLEWIASGRKLWQEYELEGVPVPQTLKRALTDKAGSSQGSVRKALVRQPDKPDKPTFANDDWLWIEAKYASVRTLVLAILRGEEEMSFKEIKTRIKNILPKFNEGTIYNICSQDEKIKKTAKGWKVDAFMDAPILYNKYVWAPVEDFQKQDLAAFRRMAIRHLLAISPDGLQVMQITRQLENADWLPTPKSKDLIKADLAIMKKAKMVKTLGHSRKWTLNTKM